jgi:hypothetical protein
VGEAPSSTPIAAPLPKPLSSPPDAALLPILAIGSRQPRETPAHQIGGRDPTPDPRQPLRRRLEPADLAWASGCQISGTAAIHGRSADSHAMRLPTSRWESRSIEPSNPIGFAMLDDEASGTNWTDVHDHSSPKIETRLPPPRGSDRIHIG